MYRKCNVFNAIIIVGRQQKETNKNSSKQLKANLMLQCGASRGVIIYAAADITLLI